MRASETGGIGERALVFSLARVNLKLGARRIGFVPQKRLSRRAPVLSRSSQTSVCRPFPYTQNGGDLLSDRSQVSQTHHGVGRTSPLLAPGLAHPLRGAAEHDQPPAAFGAPRAAGVVLRRDGIRGLRARADTPVAALAPNFSRWAKPSSTRVASSFSVASQLPDDGRSDRVRQAGWPGCRRWQISRRSVRASKRAGYSISWRRRVALRISPLRTKCTSTSSPASLPSSAR